MKKAVLVCLLSFGGVLFAGPRDYGWKSLIAICIAAETSATDVAPTPPTPSGDSCTNCGGTGKVGDGTVFVPCVPCKGTGKRIKAEPPPEIEEPIPEVKEENPETVYETKWREARSKNLPLVVFARIPAQDVPGAVTVAYKGKSFASDSIFVLTKDPNGPGMIIRLTLPASTPAGAILKGVTTSQSVPFAPAVWAFSNRPAICTT